MTPPTLREQIREAQGAGVPLVLITTADFPEMTRHLAHGWNGETPPIMVWDCARYLQGLTPDGEDAAAGLGLNEGADLHEVLNAAPRFPDHAILIVQMAHRVIDNPATIQTIINARDELKAKGAMLILLAIGPALPPELQSDVLILDDPYPTGQAIDEMIGRTIVDAREAFEVDEPDAETKRAAVGALVGLPSFPIDQSLALSVKRHKRIVVADLLERKRAIVSQVKGLKMNRNVLQPLGGLSEVLSFGAELFGGLYPPQTIVVLEEMEKAIAGFGQETSGTTGDQVGQLLTLMEDLGWSGMMGAGPPGAGKSAFAKWLAARFGACSLTLDLGGAKGSLVGQSEQQIRLALKTIMALGGDRVFFVASVNRMANVPAELRRRFRAGIWFFDLPTDEERRAIWPIQLEAFGLPLDSDRPKDDGWTGAEIRNACEFARNFRKTPREVARYITPVSVSDAETIEKLRQAAAGRWQSASYPGPYKMPGRTIHSQARAFSQ